MRNHKLIEEGKSDRWRPSPHPQLCIVGGGSRPTSLAAIMLGLLLLVGDLSPVLRLSGAPLFPPANKREAGPAPESSGPTLHLDYGRGESPGNPIAEFMYFVPLISSEPVSVVKSPGNTQCARMVSAKRVFTVGSFLVVCEFAFAGEGNQRLVFDDTQKIRRHERELKAGGSLTHQLGYINVQGAGGVRMEVEGTMTGRVATVTDVRLRFNGHGRTSVVTIGLHDIGYLDGSFLPRNEHVARVNTLSFRRKPGSPKMAVTVTSVKQKDVRDSFWNNFMGGLKATAVNLFLDPVPVTPSGNAAMLDFGGALASEAAEFTFPHSENFKTHGSGSAHQAMATN